MMHIRLGALKRTRTGPPLFYQQLSVIPVRVRFSAPNVARHFSSHTNFSMCIIGLYTLTGPFAVHHVSKPVVVS